MLWRVGGGVSRRLSIPRDTLVPIPGHGTNKINAAYAFGGPALTIKTVEQLTGIKINHVIIINFANFPKFIDAIGGVAVKTGRICSQISPVLTATQRSRLGQAQDDPFILAKLERPASPHRPTRSRRPCCGGCTSTSSGLPPVARGGRSLPRRSRPTASTRRWRRGRRACSPRRSSANAGDGTGSTWPGSPSRAARRRTSPSRMPGATAITSSTRSTPTCRSIASSLEQVAGDLLPVDGDAERARLLIATGFLAVGPKNLDEANPLQFAADVVDEQIDAVDRGVPRPTRWRAPAATTTSSTRFSMEDYYALAGVFASTKTYFGTFVSPANRVGGDPLVLPRGAGQPILHASIPPRRSPSLKAELAALSRRRRSTTLRDASAGLLGSGGIEGELEKVDETGQALPLAMGVTDRDEGRRYPVAGARRGRPTRQARAARLPAGRRDRIESLRRDRAGGSSWRTGSSRPLCPDGRLSKLVMATTRGKPRGTFLQGRFTSPHSMRGHRPPARDRSRPWPAAGPPSRRPSRADPRSHPTPRTPAGRRGAF